MWATRRSLLGICLASGFGFAPEAALADETPQAAVPVKVLPLGRPAYRASYEYSSLAWHGDTLLLMPEDPDFLYALPRAAVAEAIAAESPAPLEPEELPIENPEVFRAVHCYDGLEALAVEGERVWFAVEARCFCAMQAWVVAGRIEPEPRRIVLDPGSLTEIPLTHQACYFSVESALIHHDRLLLLEESNGANLVPAAHAAVLPLTGGAPGALPMPSIEYRVTDATAPDPSNRFWVTNYLWPQEYGVLDPAVDAFQSGATEPIAPGEPVERLLELEIQDDRIVSSGAAPIVLEPLPGEPRNWEGLVRWNDDGFLLITDAYPETILGYVARP
ncbi:MAG: hypothetical protein GC168_13310 [Candidatus Hydrogenedens sp.]|nr:hypothetical protein [Candidatus Hydrogenedens sp.]